MKILGIDTSGSIASVAICDENSVIAQTTVMTKLTHSQVILPIVERVLDDAKISLEDIDGFAVANGPGSYTGLRIGIAAVKAMCFSLTKKCAGISTLESLAYNCIGSKSIIISAMRARPDIAYWAAFKSDGTSLTRLTEDTVCGIDEIKTYAESIDSDIILVGDYSTYCFEKLFCDNINVRIACPHERLQLASSLCFATISNQDRLCEPENLDASYLQVTKAEKDKHFKV